MNTRPATAVAIARPADTRSVGLIALAGLLIVILLQGVGLLLLGAGCGPPF